MNAVDKTEYQDLISIVVPVYNAERFLHDTIQTVKGQTYTNWELILVDDSSSDESYTISRQYQLQDPRIKLVSMDVNSGAALSRNKGIGIASGKYLAFLDADDLWDNQKLEKQVAFMGAKSCAFSFTGYEFANADGVPNGKKVYIPETLSYRQGLRNTTLSTITVMFDISMLKKDDVLMPNVKSEDTACWWKVLKIVDQAYGLNELLSIYRRTPGTLSANKFQSAQNMLSLYRNVEHLGYLSTIYNFLGYAYNATKRRI
jgi:teichuronic acid biosynthesis glycosyltransferase TuaG